MTVPSDRMVWLDALRLIAGISMVGLHGSTDANGQPFPDASPPERLGPLVFRMIIYTARTELFLIISIFLLLMALERRPRGYFETLKEQARRLLIPFAFWTVFYALYSLIKAYSYGYQDAIFNDLQSVSAWLGYFVLGDVKYHMHFIPASGKSLLLSSLISPFDLCALNIEGSVEFNEVNLWDRSARSQIVPAVYLPKEPILLPTSGSQNLTCFQDDRVKERARKVMEQMLYSGEAADRILNAHDATLLSASEQKALSFAQAFILNPGLYLIDQPEVSASEAMIAALCQRFQIERRAGRSFVVATDNRAIHEMADFLLVMSDGKVIDYGPSDDVRARMSSGWARLVVDRNLDSEETVQNWIRSHFRRDGDEKNRRNISIVASEMLALSCQDATSFAEDRVSFDFKHQKEQCILRFKDQGELLTSGQMAKAGATNSVNSNSDEQTALARVLRGTLSFDQSLVDGVRTGSVTIKTYDPRLTKRDQVVENAD